MSARQHAPLIYVSDQEGSRILNPMGRTSTKFAGGYDEAWIQDLVHRHPQTLPLQEIDPSFGPLVPICTELDMRGAGFADILFINPLGMPTLVECKLWRNPEARREVVGQILDYARALRTWGYVDLQREAARARKQPGFDLVEHVRSNGHPELDEAAFVDNVGRNLRQGRMLLLILGDGIREGVEAIAEYLQDTTMQFTLGLVEAQIYDLGEGRRIVQPRVLAKTMIVNRMVVESRPLHDVISTGDESENDEIPDMPLEMAPKDAWRLQFWSDLIAGLKLDDSSQPMAKPLKQGNIFFSFQPKSSMWLTCYFLEKEHCIGVFLGSTRTAQVAMEIGRRLEAERERIDQAFGQSVTWTRDESGKVSISRKKTYSDLYSDDVRAEQLAWFRSNINDFINVLRPRIGGHLKDILEGR